MKLLYKLSITIKILLGLLFFYPTLSFAHLIAITPTVPFPAKVFTSSTTTATYTVTNITSRTPLTIVTTLSGPFSVVSSTCGVLVGPGKSCATTVKLVAPNSPTVISSNFRAVGKPSLDGVQIPVNILIVKQTQLDTVTVTLSNSSIAAQSNFTIINTLNGSGTDTLSATLPSGMSFVGASSCTVSPSVPSCSLTVNSGSAAAGSYTIIPIRITGSANIISSPNPLTIAVTALTSFVSAGQDLTGTNPPLLVASVDKGNTWAVKSIPNLPATGEFFGTSCTGSGSTAICTAAGEDSPLSSGPPILAISTTGGNTWNLAQNIALPTSGQFFGTSCTGSGSTTTCIAEGQDFTTNDPLLVVSQNDGSSWQTIPLTTLVNPTALLAGNCIGSGANAACVVVGLDGNFAPVVVTSTDNGNTWHPQTITNAPPAGELHTVSCTGSGSTAICVAGGTLDGTPGPLLLVSTAGVNNWALQTVVGAPSSTAIYNASSCTGSGSNAVCIAAGFDQIQQLPFLVVGTNGGNTWNLASISPLSSPNAFLGASCTGSGSSALCVAVGGDNSNNSQPPLIVVSTDGGSTWSVKTSIANFSGNGVLESVTCIPSTSGATCTAAGTTNTNGGAPIIVMSFDAGNTWSLVNNIPNLPSSGILNATTSTSFSKQFGIKNILKKFLTN